MRRFHFFFYSGGSKVAKRKVWRALHECRSLIGHIPDEPYIPAATLPLCRERSGILSTCDSVSEVPMFLDLSPCWRNSYFFSKVLLGFDIGKCFSFETGKELGKFKENFFTIVILVLASITSL